MRIRSERWRHLERKFLAFNEFELNVFVSCVAASLSSNSFAFSKNLRSYVSPAHGI